MSNGDRTQGERITSLEAIGQERKEDIAAWRLAVETRFDKADTKLDELLRNGKKAISLDILEQALTAHVTSCPSRNPSNPGPKNDSDSNEKIDLILRGYRGLGIVGTMLALNAMLMLIVMKLVGVF